jgi:hypothetical protein
MNLKEIMWEGVDFATESRPALRPHQPPIQWVPENLFLGVKRSVVKLATQPPSSAEVKKAWSYNSTPQYISWHGA